MVRKNTRVVLSLTESASTASTMRLLNCRTCTTPIARTACVHRSTFKVAGTAEIYTRQTTHTQRTRVVSTTASARPVTLFRSRTSSWRFFTKSMMFLVARRTVCSRFRKAIRQATDSTPIFRTAGTRMCLQTQPEIVLLLTILGRSPTVRFCKKLSRMHLNLTVPRGRHRLTREYPASSISCQAA